MTLTIDWGLFGDDAVPADVRRQVAAVEAALASEPPLDRVPVAETRRKIAEGVGLFERPARSRIAEDVFVAGPHGPVPLRVYRPARPARTILHIHGGGFVFGSPATTDHMQERLALSANATVVSVDYRLAPEHRWPVPVDDCMAAAEWLLAVCGGWAGGERLAVAGESAGANLAAVTLLRLRARDQARRFGHAVFTYGFFDLALTPSARRWGGRNLILTTDVLDWYAREYAPGADLADPEISPLRAGLGAMPPALFVVGTLDPLLDDSLMMAARWAGAGSRAELMVLPGAIHGFDGAQRPGRQAREALARTTAFLDGDGG